MELEKIDIYSPDNYVEAVPHEAFARPAPYVEPGTYRVRVEAGGDSADAAFDVLDG